jgi:hypothetical protein
LFLLFFLDEKKKQKKSRTNDASPFVLGSMLVENLDRSTPLRVFRKYCRRCHFASQNEGAGWPQKNVVPPPPLAIFLQP